MRGFNPQMRKTGSEQNSLSASSHLHLPCEPGPFTQTQNKGVSLRASVSQADFSLKSLPSWREKLQANPQPLCFLFVNLIMVTISRYSWQAMAAPCLSCFPCCSDRIAPKEGNLVGELNRRLCSQSPHCSSRESAWLLPEPEPH